MQQWAAQISAALGGRAAGQPGAAPGNANGLLVAAPAANPASGIVVTEAKASTGAKSAQEGRIGQVVYDLAGMDSLVKQHPAATVALAFSE